MVARREGITNYVTLVDLLEAWRAEELANRRVSYATFNYDLLLEWAIRDVTARDFLSVSDWIRRDTPVYKLHGSTNWGRIVTNPAGFGWDPAVGGQVSPAVRH